MFPSIVNLVTKPGLTLVSTTTVSATIAMTAFYGDHGREPIRTIPSHQDDSIEEIASMLLDETTMDQFNGEPGKRLSQIAAAKTFPQPPCSAAQDSKALPQLPQLLFNGDDAWAMRSSPVMTAAGGCNEVQFSAGDEEPDSYPPNLSRQPPHVRKCSAPPLPRRSSKRNSARPKKPDSEAKSQATFLQDGPNGSNKQKRLVESDITPPKQIVHPEPKTSTSVEAADVNNKIEAMMAATKSLKPSANGNLLHGPVVPDKKRRFKDNVLVKMKTAINDRLQVRSNRKRHDPARDDHLLDNNLNEMPEYDEDGSAVSAMEIRMNEGKPSQILFYVFELTLGL
jgi:hypothetical protein